MTPAQLPKEIVLQLVVQQQVLQDFSFDDDGTRMYVIETATTPATTYIYVYKLSTGFDITTATFAGKVQQVFESLGSDGTNGTPLGMGFSEDGMKFYQVTYQDGHRLVSVIEYMNMI